jgi:hypothetical protein
VTATLGPFHADARLNVTSLAPKLKLKLKRSHAVTIDLATRRGRLPATCQAPRGEICSVAGKLMTRLQHRTVTISTLKARLRAGRGGGLTITVSKATAATLRQHGSLTTTAAMRVSDLSGRGSAVVTLSLKPA